MIVEDPTQEYKRQIILLQCEALIYWLYTDPIHSFFVFLVPQIIGFFFSFFFFLAVRGSFTSFVLCIVGI